MSLSVTTRLELTGAVVITARGTVEHADVAALLAAVRAAASNYRPPVVYLDLAMVTFLTSAGVLAVGQTAAHAAGSQLIVLRPSPVVRRMIELHHLDITVHD